MILSNRRGATLIELVITILVISIIAGATAGIVVSLMQLFVYLPREMRVRSIAHEVMDVMIEGDAQNRGMRYAVEVLSAYRNEFAYIVGYPGYADKRIIRFLWDSASKKIYRYSCSYAALSDPDERIVEELIPYYAKGDISITGSSTSPNVIFTYFKGGTEPWYGPVEHLSRIGRVEITIVVKTGSGLFERWESSFQTTSSVDIKQYIHYK